MTDFNASKILGGYVCFYAYNDIYDSGIRIRKGYNAASTDASITYAYSSAICVPVTPVYNNSSYAAGEMNMFNRTDKFDNEKYPTSINHYIRAEVRPTGLISYDFVVAQISNYNSNYSSGTTNSIFEILGDSYRMWGEIYYE